MSTQGLDALPLAPFLEILAMKNYSPTVFSVWNPTLVDPAVEGRLGDSE